MSSDFHDPFAIDFDPKQLSRLIFLFNIARRNTTSYPADHPLILRAAHNFLIQLDSLLQFSDELTIGVARDTLLAGNASLEKNAVFVDLAQTLFACDIASFTLRRSLTQTELCLFFDLLNREPDEIRRLGGFSRLLREEGVAGISVLDINYQALHTTEYDRIIAPKDHDEMAAEELPWDGFISSLIQGELSNDGSGTSSRQIDPELLAQMLNRQGLNAAEAADLPRPTARTVAVADGYGETITSFFKQIDQEGLDARAREESLHKMSLFIDRLNPELRRNLLNSTFATSDGHGTATEALLNGLSPETLMDIINDVSEDRISVPPGLFNLLSKLSRTSAGPEGAARVIGRTTDLSEEALDERVRTLFRAGHTTEFIPEDYQQLMQELLDTGKLDNLPGEAVDELCHDLQGHGIETSVMEVVLELIDTDPLSEQAELLAQNLADLVHYFVEVGDYLSLVVVYDRLLRHHEEAEAFSIPIAEQTLRIYRDDDFVAEVLDGLEIWGRRKHDEIRTLVAHVGAPFVKPLILRLGEAGEMAMRQFLLGVLFDIGEPAKTGSLAHLHDSRWYLVRNLVMLLRRFGDPAVMPAIYRLIGHPHPKIHLEALKTYLHFNDPKAPQYLLREMDNAHLERRKNAAFLSRNCASPPVRRRLLELLLESAGDPNYELRRIVLQTLAEIGDPQCIPALRTVLQSRNLLRPLQHREFRELAFRSLQYYPRQTVMPLLEELAAEKKGDFAVQAGAILQKYAPGENI